MHYGSRVNAYTHNLQEASATVEGFKVLNAIGKEDQF